MKIQNSTDIPASSVRMEGAARCCVRQLIGPVDGAPTFAMRQFEIEPGGHTPRHFHDYEHEVYVLEGEGELRAADTSHPLRSGDVVLVKPDEIHQFRNTGTGLLKMLCLIPNSATGKTVNVVPECGPEN
jgi:quercetin dioxygenase-like cupin family protein